MSFGSVVDGILDGYGKSCWVVEELWNNVENVNVVIYFFLSYLVIRKCTYDETNERIAKKSISSYTQTSFFFAYFW